MEDREFVALLSRLPPKLPRLPGVSRSRAQATIAQLGAGAPASGGGGGGPQTGPQPGPLPPPAGPQLGTAGRCWAQPAHMGEHLSRSPHTASRLLKAEAFRSVLLHARHHTTLLVLTALFPPFPGHPAGRSPGAACCWVCQTTPWTECCHGRLPSDRCSQPAHTMSPAMLLFVLPPPATQIHTRSRASVAAMCDNTALLAAPQPSHAPFPALPRCNLTQRQRTQPRLQQPTGAPQQERRMGSPRVSPDAASLRWHSLACKDVCFSNNRTACARVLASFPARFVSGTALAQQFFGAAIKPGPQAPVPTPLTPPIWRPTDEGPDDVVTSAEAAETALPSASPASGAHPHAPGAPTGGPPLTAGLQVCYAPARCARTPCLAWNSRALPRMLLCSARFRPSLRRPQRGAAVGHCAAPGSPLTRPSCLAFKPRPRPNPYQPHPNPTRPTQPDPPNPTHPNPPQAEHDAAAGHPLPEAQRRQLLAGLNRRYRETVQQSEAEEMTALLGAQHLFKCTVH